MSTSRADDGGRGAPSLLFAPFDVGGVRLPNRVVLPAMVTRLSGDDGHVNVDIRDRYLRYARGEPGLMVLEAMGVHDVASGPLLRAGHDRFVPGLRDLVARVHGSSPTRVAAQIIHFLKISRSGWRQRIQDLGRDEIAAIPELYAAAAARVRDAGFDAVELHMAHAYTLSSFLSRMNDRHDEYGGRAIENRLRLPSEVLRRVRERVGADYCIGIRYDGEEAIKDGYSVEDAAAFAVRFARVGADYLSISAGGKFEDAVKKPNEPLYPYTGYSGDRCMPSAGYPDGLNVYLAEGIRAALRAHGLTTPVVATGKIRTPELAESLLRDGRADLIGMARQLLADPDWPRKVRDGHADTVVPCVYNNVCKALDERFHKVRCTLWRGGDLHAPEAPEAPEEPARTAAQDRAGDGPRWPEGARLEAAPWRGRVRLQWPAALSGAGAGAGAGAGRGGTGADTRPYGYLVMRADGGGPWRHIDSARGVAKRFDDCAAIAGSDYRYRVVAYDLAGRRSEPLGPVEIRLPETPS
jgi:2,4-dienoyl-CoA reductase-like NADH-dependent reductase (Old Yellow Enzyme family)